MIDLMNSLTWPAVFAIVGSLVTIVTGLFGYLLSSRKQHKPDILSYEKLHSRINTLMERIVTDEGDLKEIRGSLRTLQKQIGDHEHRDIEDFRLVEAKLDRLMDIVVRILQDDHL